MDPSVDQSGQRDRRGRITRHGDGLLRRMLIEAAWSAARPGFSSRVSTTFRGYLSPPGNPTFPARQGSWGDQTVSSVRWPARSTGGPAP
ncbi:MAG: transposase [Armatimonadota bacterium]|nr:transposase [Armatimonadota bacterium]